MNAQVKEIRDEIERRKAYFEREKAKAVSDSDKLSLGARIAMLEEVLVIIDTTPGVAKDTKRDDEKVIKGVVCKSPIPSGYFKGRNDVSISLIPDSLPEYEDCDPIDFIIKARDGEE